jgi:uncharacterized Ntn-hydrolase superfamily protein
VVLDANVREPRKGAFLQGASPISLSKSTFSIVAADLEAGEVGCAVQSRYFSVGSVVPWARAGVGAAATQAAGVAIYGKRALDELARGASPEEALERVVADDPGRETRQLGLVTADGRAAAFTGADCLDWAGHRVGAGFAVQGNILAGAAVVEEMARAYEEVVGPLVERLVAALEAGQAAGGDKRGQQSAAIVVERLGAHSESREGIDRVCDLRVEDHPEPIVELRRLLGIWTGRQAQGKAAAFAEREEYGEAAAVLRHELERAEDSLLLYNLACYESLAGQTNDAVAHLRRAVELDPSYRAVAAQDTDFDPVRSEISEL